MGFEKYLIIEATEQQIEAPTEDSNNKTPPQTPTNSRSNEALISTLTPIEPQATQNKPN